MSADLLPLLLLLAPMLARCQLRVETDDAIYVGRALSLGPGLQTIAHLGIRYAEPPVGQLRFAAPVPWTLPRGNDSDTADTDLSDKPEINATRAGPACLQRPDAAGTLSRMSEDCLYLNVHSPSIHLAPPAVRPVLVWLHGGYFKTGAIGDPDEGRESVGDLVANRQSLLAVEVAHRLGVFGFLSNRGVGANAGLRDQQVALAWIGRNIGFFGGDNGSVTLAGLDAGSAAVGFHQLSAGSRDLFQRCMFLGGSPLAGWAFVRDRSALERYHRDFYQLAGCRGIDDAGTLACLRNLSAAELNARQAEFGGDGPTVDLVEFPPVVDGQFIEVDPLEAFERGRFDAKPAIIGAANLEGAQLAYRALASVNISDESQLVGERHRSLVQRTFRYLPRFPEQPTRLAQDFLTAQLTAYDSEAAGRGNLGLLIRAISQRVTVCDSNRFADRLSNLSAPVFAYLLAEPDSRVEYLGASHGRDAAYFFGAPLRQAGHTDEQRSLSRQMMSQLVEFLASGNLSLSQTGWNRTSRSGLQFYRFAAASSALLRGGYDRQDCRLWSDILPWLSDNSGRVDTTTTLPVSTTTENAEAKFWERCNATVNTVSLIAIGIGGGAVLLLIVCVVLVARGRRGSGHDSLELYQRVSPVSAVRK